MPMCKGCFCWRDLKIATAATAVLTAVTSLIQILVVVAAFTAWVELNPGAQLFSATGSPPTGPPTSYYLYIALAGADLIVVLLSFTLLFGVDLEVGKRCFIYPWILLMPFYILYECAINIYFFYSAFQARAGNTVYITPVYGYLIVPLVYWVIKDLLIVVGWFAVISRVQQMSSDKKGFADTIPLRADDPSAASSGPSQPKPTNQGTVYTAQQNNPVAFTPNYPNRAPMQGIYDQPRVPRPVLATTAFPVYMGRRLYQPSPAAGTGYNPYSGY